MGHMSTKLWPMSHSDNDEDDNLPRLDIQSLIQGKTANVLTMVQNRSLKSNETRHSPTRQAKMKISYYREVSPTSAAISSSISFFSSENSDASDFEDGNTVSSSSLVSGFKVSTPDSTEGQTAQKPQPGIPHDSSPALCTPKKDRTALQIRSTPPSVSNQPSSPRKRQALPPSPYKTNDKRFWDEEVTAKWVDKHSVKSPLKGLTSCSKDLKAGKIQKQAFQKSKNELASQYLSLIDTKVFDGELDRITKPTGGVHLVWNSHLQTTAGRAAWRKEKMIERFNDDTLPERITKTVLHHASIQLSSKVIDCEERLLNAIAHEMCHLATWIIDNTHQQPHGPVFKKWAAKCNRLLGKQGVFVSTTHSFEIDYKYAWTCSNPWCGIVYQRHSKCLSPQKHACSNCRSQLTQTKPVPKMKPFTPSDYQIYLKNNLKNVKRRFPGSPHKEAMSILAKEYRAHKSAVTDGDNSQMTLMLSTLSLQDSASI